jgi:glycosyltransferase involved in cell wall biosynthesis
MSKESKTLPISLAVISFNEESRIGKCFRSVEGLVSEIIVVDSGSSDGTDGVAKAAGARVISQPWLGQSAQKQVALNHCTLPWVLMLDCDEELSGELREAIWNFFLNGDADWFRGAEFNRKVRFLGRWITHGDWYPDTKLRLFQRVHARMGGNASHDTVLLDGNIKHLRGDILHDSYPTIQSYVAKISPFAEEFAERQRKEGRRWSLATNLFRPLWRFVRAYFIRFGFMDGFPGFWIAYATAFSVFVRYSMNYDDEVKTRLSALERQGP